MTILDFRLPIADFKSKIENHKSKMVLDDVASD